MMSESASSTKRDRPFPWLCTHCKEKEVFPLATDYTANLTHEGLTHVIHIPALLIPTCRNCGQRTFTPGVGDRIHAALRTHLGLLGFFY